MNKKYYKCIEKYKGVSDLHMLYEGIEVFFHWFTRWLNYTTKKNNNYFVLVYILMQA
jgi:hypothetical protein